MKIMNAVFDYSKASDCVKRGMFLMTKFKEQCKEDGIAHNVNFSTWAVEQAIINRANSETMMTAVIRHVESVESQVMNYNAIHA